MILGIKVPVREKELGNNMTRFRINEILNQSVFDLLVTSGERKAFL